MSDYSKVFDIADSGFRSYEFVLSGVLFIAIGLVINYGGEYLKKVQVFRSTSDTKFNRFFKKFFLGFSIFWTVLAFSSTFYEYVKLRSSDCLTLEGTVENYIQGPKSESFTVSGVHFNYSDYVVTNGFNNMASQGGPIRSGLQVRICYVPHKNENAITRLEIKNLHGAHQDYSKSEALTGNDKFNSSDKTIGDFNLFQSQKYFLIIAPIFIFDFLIYSLMFLPAFFVYFKVSLLDFNFENVPSFQSFHGKKDFQNMTLICDGSDAIWARPYGLEIFQTPGFICKINLNPERKIRNVEVRFSSLIVFFLLCFIVIGILFFQEALVSQKQSDIQFAKFLPLFFIPMGAVQFHFLKKRFLLRAKEFFSRATV